MSMLGNYFLSLVDHLSFPHINDFPSILHFLIFSHTVSGSFPLVPAPCGVQDVLTKLNCSTNALSVSWTPGSIPVNYSTTAVAANGTALRCFTEDHQCTLAGLQCGHQYAVSVKPISGTCEGQSSVPEVVNSGTSTRQNHSHLTISPSPPSLMMFPVYLPVPCVPVDVRGSVECSSSTLRASWNAAGGAASYVSFLKGAGGFSASCQTANQSCSFPGLQCAQTYSFSVVAINDRCNSTESSAVTAMTGKTETLQQLQVCGRIFILFFMIFTPKTPRV